MVALHNRLESTQMKVWLGASWEPTAVDWRGRLWTVVDTSSLRHQTEWTPVDAYGLRLEIYGSGGRGFESLQAR